MAYISISTSFLRKNSDNNINELVKYKTVEQKVLFVILSEVQKVSGYCPTNTITIKYSQIKEMAGLPTHSSNKIHTILNNISVLSMIERNDKETVTVTLSSDYKNTVAGEHMIDLADLMKCKSEIQLKLYIIMSSKNNSYIYRNVLFCLLEMKKETVEQKKDSVKVIKRSLAAMEKNELVSKVKYNAEEKAFFYETISSYKAAEIEEEIFW